MGDAYLATGQQYSRISNGVESPTYTVLEPAPARSAYPSGIYSPPVSYRSDFLGSGNPDHPIYTVKPPPNNAR